MSLGITIQPEPLRDQREDVCQSRASSGSPIRAATQLQWFPREWELDALIKIHKTTRHEAKKMKQNFTFFTYLSLEAVAFTILQQIANSVFF